MFYLRLIKYCKLNINKYRECIKLFKERFDENKYAINRLSLVYTFKLIKRFGIKTVI